MTKSVDQSFNSFYRNELFPDASSVFSWRPKPINEIKSTCTVVLDTNILLVPYTVSPQSLGKIGSVYRDLQLQGRLTIPGQVAREYALNRDHKIGEMVQKLLDASSKAAVPSFDRYPLLENLKEYEELLSVQREMNEQSTKLKKATRALTSRVNDWTWEDPISSLYAELLAESVFDPTLDEAAVLHDMEYRTTHKVPPGYKDSGKDDGGIGDLLIWHAILQLGRDRNLDMIFVTAEEKSDWWQKSGNTLLCPRTELVEEYRRASEGCTFHILSLSSLLQLYEASDEVVSEVRTQEELVGERPNIELFDLKALTNETSVRLDRIFIDKVMSCLGSERVLVREPHPGLHADFVVNVGRRGHFRTLVEIKTIFNLAAMSPSDVDRGLEQLQISGQRYINIPTEGVRYMLVFLLNSQTHELTNRAVTSLRRNLEEYGGSRPSNVSIHLFTYSQLMDMSCGQIEQMFDYPILSGNSLVH